MAVGHFILPDALVSHCSQIIQLGLYLLLFLVGLDMGRQEGMLENIRQAGLGVLLVPVAVMVGTFAVTALAGLFLPLGPKDCVAASAGFGWYSLAPTLLAPYSLSVSATAFLSNIMHELFSIVLVPIVAHRLGYIEAVALPGATAMDTVLPVVVSATDQRMAIYSFTSGAFSLCRFPSLSPPLSPCPSKLVATIPLPFASIWIETHWKKETAWRTSRSSNYIGPAGAGHLGERPEIRRLLPLHRPAHPGGGGGRGGVRQ